MYVRSISLKNIGPIEELKIEPRFATTGQPIPLVLVGQNGAGKSLALSLVLDSLIEARRKSFREIPEVEGTDYLRLSSKNYVRRGGNYSHAEVKLSDGTNEIRFNEIISLVDFDTFKASATIEVLALPGIQNDEFKDSGFYKEIVMPHLAASEIKKLSFTYFPYFRYEKPYWLSVKAHVDFAETANWYGIAHYNPIRTNVIEDTKRWILNVVFDRELYERVVAPLPGQSGQNLQLFLGYNGPNERSVALVNEIILGMLKTTDPNFVSARIGIGTKQNRELSVFGTKQGKSEEVIAPELGQLSSGQLMALGLATELIRAHEVAHGSSPNQLQDVKGIALIDEVDLHLHISFQKTLMPVLLRKFPGVQFILTTHSPFFLLGMAEADELDIYNLPIGNKINPEEFSEFEAGYDVFVKKNEQFRARYQELSDQVQIVGKPLIITEGKTDWQHLKRALAKFNAAGQYTDLDIEFLEFDDPDTMGDEKLVQMCETSPLLKLQRKLIFIFDRDKPRIFSRMSGSPNDFRVVNTSGVYSFCIPVPAHRTNYEKITIEMYYTDTDLRTADPATGKRLWFSNEIQIIKHPTSGENEFKTLTSPEANDELKKWVFDEPAEKITDGQGNSVGLSKSAFVTTIVDNSQISRGFDRSAFAAIFDVIQKIVT